MSLAIEKRRVFFYKWPSDLDFSTPFLTCLKGNGSGQAEGASCPKMGYCLYVRSFTQVF